MPAFLLICCLVLNSSNSCSERHNKAIPPISAQAEVAQLNDLLEQLNRSDEPALRIFLRLKIAAFLWNTPSASVRPESLIAAAFADIRAHEKEIPTLYLDLFRRDLIAQLKAHGLDTSAYLPDGKAQERRTELEVAYSLLGQENGADKAVSIVQRSVAGGKDPGRIIVPFLHRLEQSSPADVIKLLDAIMSAEELSPGTMSTGTMFALKHLIIREQTSQDLQRRYVASLISRAGEKEASVGSLVDIYTILSDVLPGLEKQSPELYQSASARVFELEGRVPRATVERLAINKRVNQSSDPLAQLLLESEAVSDPSLKNDLRVEAAQMALEKGQIRTAIDAIVKMPPRNETAELWQDQFLEGAVERSLTKGDVETSRYGANQIRSAFIRSSALQKIALYYQSSNNSASAREALNSALKSVTSSDDSIDKAVALLDLSRSFLKVDAKRASELTRTAVKVINKSPEVLRRAERGSDIQLGDVESMMKIAYRLIPTFQALGALNESAALDTALDIQRPEFRIAATFGASTNSPVTDKNSRGVASK